MKTFNDTSNRTWTISLTLGTAMAVKDKLGIDLLSPEEGDPPLLTRLGTDEIFLGQVLLALLEPQFEANKVTAEEVRNSFDGQMLLAAQKAFYEELIDFFQKRGRTDRSKAVATQVKIIETAVAAVEAKINGMDVGRMIDGAMSGSSAEASASTPES